MFLHVTSVFVDIDKWTNKQHLSIDKENKRSSLRDAPWNSI